MIYYKVNEACSENKEPIKNKNLQNITHFNANNSQPKANKNTYFGAKNVKRTHCK